VLLGIGSVLAGHGARVVVGGDQFVGAFVRGVGRSVALVWIAAGVLLFVAGSAIARPGDRLVSPNGLHTSHSAIPAGPSSIWSRAAVAPEQPLIGARLRPTAQLSVDTTGGQTLLYSGAMSDGLVVAGADEPGSFPPPTAVYVYTEPAAGWSAETETATLIASDGQPVNGSVATTGDTVVAGGGSGLYVFEKPPGGWSGTINESAKLTFSDLAARYVTWLAASGETIVVVSLLDSCSCSPAVDVFMMPPGGWAGTISASATLAIPDPVYPCVSGPYSVAIDGPTIAAACSHEADVFTEPPGGWSGTISPSGTLPVPATRTFVESVAVLGPTIAVASTGVRTAPDPALFTEPAGGWSGSVEPSGNLDLGPTGGQVLDEYLVGSGNTIAADVIPSGSACGVECEGGTLYAFTRPFGGWSGTVTGPSAGVATAGDLPGAFATDGTTIAAEGSTSVTADGSSSVDLFTIVPGHPSATSVSLTGLATGSPALRFTLQAGQSAAPIRSLQLTLPRGLRFTDHPRAVRTSSATQRVRLRPDTLALTLRTPAQTLAISITRPALEQLKALTAKVRRVRRYNRTHRRKRTLEIRPRGVVTDAADQATNLTLITRIP
jgi:hypothetical protein